MTTISSACLKCGITKKSGKMSCCGRGGSWFGNCGSARDTNTDHTWHEGLQACKAQTQSKLVVSQQFSAQQGENGPSNSEDDTNSKTIITTGKPHAFILAPIPGVPPADTQTHVPVNILTTRIASTMSSEPVNAAIDKITYMSADMTAVSTSITAANTPNVTLTRVLPSTQVHAPFSSRGCQKVLDTTVCTTFVISVILLRCQLFNTICA